MTISTKWLLCVVSCGLFLLSQSFVKAWVEKETVLHLDDYSFNFGYADQTWRFPVVAHFSPLSPTPHVVCVAGWLLGPYQELFSFVTFSLVMPRNQKGIMSAAVCSCGSGSTEPGRFHRTRLWTAVLNDALLWNLEDPVVKMIITQSLQMPLWTFHSHAQAVLHVSCRQGEVISKEIFCAFLDDILLLSQPFSCLPFPPPSYINSISSSFRDRWWAGDTNELPAAQGRQPEMLCVLRTNRLSTLTKDVSHAMKGLMHKYCSRLSSHAPMNRVFPREQLPETAYLIVRSLLCLLGYCSEWYNNFSLLWRWRER